MDINDISLNGDFIAPNDSISEESYFILDFPEFNSTLLFLDSEFGPALNLEDGSFLYNIVNCSFKSIILKSIDGDGPSCVLNNNLTLMGSHTSNGLTYMIIDEKELNEENDRVNYTKSSQNDGIRYTDKCIEFTAKH